MQLEKEWEGISARALKIPREEAIYVKKRPKIRNYAVLNLDGGGRKWFRGATPENLSGYV